MFALLLQLLEIDWIAEIINMMEKVWEREKVNKKHGILGEWAASKRTNASERGGYGWLVTGLYNKGMDDGSVGGWVCGMNNGNEWLNSIELIWILCEEDGF